jgi:hypothetical protein
LTTSSANWLRKAFALPDSASLQNGLIWTIGLLAGEGNLFRLIRRTQMEAPPQGRRESLLSKLDTFDDEQIQVLAELWELVPENHWIPGPPAENDRAEIIQQLVNLETFTLN